jgi:hypothetical protein
MVFLPIVAALAAYPITRKSEKAGNALIIGVTLAIFVMALSLLKSTLTGSQLPGFCGSGLSLFGSSGLRFFPCQTVSFRLLFCRQPA